jgi:hypothetical protein
MHKNPVREIIRPQLAELIIGTGMAASIQFGIRLIPLEDSFFNYASALYFFAGLFLGFFIPGFSWKGGIWLTLPWIAWIFFNIASAEFKDGIWESLGWLFLYSFPLLPASTGAFTGAVIARWKKKLTS